MFQASYAARVLKALKAQGVKILALRCSGTNNVDIKTAKEIGAFAQGRPATPLWDWLDTTIGATQDLTG
eukprot:Skav221582  [mRNA]  locus=scaffold630:113975:115007:- [translate_table: standard]